MNDFDKYPEFERDPEYIVGKNVTFISDELKYQLDLTVRRFDPWTGLHDVRLTADDPNQDEEQHAGLSLIGMSTGWKRLRHYEIKYPARGKELWQLVHYYPTDYGSSEMRCLGQTLEVGKFDDMDLDFEIKIGESECGTCFKISKMFLKMNSPVFRTILRGDAEAKRVDFSRDLKDYEGIKRNEEYLNSCSWYLFLRQCVPRHDLHKDYRDLNLWRFEGQRVLMGAVRLAHKYDCPAILARIDRLLAVKCWAGMEMLERASMHNAKETVDKCVSYCYNSKDALRAPEKLCKYVRTKSITQSRIPRNLKLLATRKHHARLCTF